jgi:flavin-dependent dehydrogenase
VLDVDALIVGAGTAGAAAALSLAPFRRVLVVDRQAAPRSRSGESLPGAAQRLLVAMGLWEGFLTDGHASCQAYRSVWGGSEPVERDTLCDPDGCGWHLDKAGFERRLRAAAIARGATLLAPARPVGTERAADGWLVSLDVAGRSRKIRARLLIDAGGKTSRLLGRFRPRRSVQSRLICGWVVSADAELPRGLIQIEAEAEGWWHAAPLPAGGGILAYYTDADLPAARSARSAEGVLARAKCLPMLGEFVRPKHWRGAIGGVCAANGGGLDIPIGSDWIAAGDAALSFDPLSAQGIFNALYTGRAAAEAAHRRLSGDIAASADYAERLRGIGVAYVQHLAAWYGLERRWPESPFWRRRHISGPE